MPPVSQLGDYWDQDVYASPCVRVDCLMPTGIIVAIDVERDATISEIKADLWNAAQAYPLYSALKDKNSYNFMCVTQNAEKVELVDEDSRLWDVKPFQPMLKVVEKKGNEQEKRLNGQISALLGKGLQEFDNLKSNEVSDFRQKMRKKCELIAKERDSQNWLQRSMCLYPPDVADSTALPIHLESKFRTKTFDIKIRLDDSVHANSVAYSVSTTAFATPEDLKLEFLNLHARKTGFRLGAEEDFALKIHGREEYLLGQYPVSQFKYIRRMIGKDSTPVLVLVSKDRVLASAPPTIPPKNISGHQSHPSRNAPMPPPRQGSVPRMRVGGTTWDCDESFSFTVHGISIKDYDDFTRFELRACLYHGPEPLTEVITTEEIVLNSGFISCDQEFAFKIALRDIPRMARLCFMMSVIVDRRTKDKRQGTNPRPSRQRGKDFLPIAWVNIPVFDYQDVLRTGQCQLYMWRLVHDDTLSEEDLNPIGTVEDNPLVQESPCLNIEFRRFSDQPLMYPDFQHVLEVAARTVKSDSVPILDRKQEQQRLHLDDLETIVTRDPLTELCEQDKEKVWRLRNECQYYYPSSLPRLLMCVKWDNHIDVAQMMALLQIWKPLPAIEALELLDFAYADKSVRSFAIKCIRHLSDAELLQYLLQLVQVLKYESYLECELVEFLLERCLKNNTLGHHMFWLLRSEMHVPSFGVRFGLVLEAYCRSNINHMNTVSKQVQALDKLKIISVGVKNEKAVKQAKEFLIRAVTEDAYKTSLSDLTSTLNPAYRLAKLRPDKCKVMDSKMRPLWLVWENIDHGADDVYVMYKKGDDMRQDMLTLQILRIMDHIWQEAGLDLRMNAYGCLPTGHSEGLLEVVTESDTIANIQKEYSGLKLKSAFNKTCLYEWLKKHNPNEKQFASALEEFALSCAGYCVATYVLGVADRHSDNILLKKNGQLFHIDFGHFLGNFKVKLGMKRERVPFVLTADYVYVITKGTKDQQAFKRFKKTCEDAFMILRDQANFLITLFMMMVNTGIPELSSLKDIEYLKQMLVPSLSQEDAREHFRMVFQEALKNSWKAAVNNAFHNFAKDNK